MTRPTKLYMGWDVGGWHCDRNKASRDALAVTTLVDGSVGVVGRPWRGNLRALLMAKTGDALVRAMLGLCAVEAEQNAEVVVAVDTPLGWPSAMMRLAQGGATSFVSASDGENPYTRRATELDLVRRGFAPLSAVRDMLGSQSTKGIHFLRAAGLDEVSCGVWRHEVEKGLTVVAIETYPAVALQSGRLGATLASMLGRADPDLAGGSKRLHDDIRDALACALVAHLFSENPRTMESVPADVPAGEGWIMLPVV